MRNPHAKFTNPSDFVSNHGSKFHTLRKGVVAEDGNINLVEYDKIDIQAEIDSHFAECDLSSILARFAAGDTTVLNRVNGFYGDATEMPKTMAEAMQLSINAEQEFLALPLSIRNKFDNNWIKWLTTFGTDKWREFMTLDSTQPPMDAEIVEKKEVLTDEP